MSAQPSFHFTANNAIAMPTMVARFIEKERPCCPFMKFVAETEEEHDPIWAKITGRKGAKEFIREEFDLDRLIK